MKRKLVKITLVLTGLLLIGVFLLGPRDRITKASWDEIRVGMTEKEVEQILGGPGRSLDGFWDHMRAIKKQSGQARPLVYDHKRSFAEPEIIIVSNEKDRYWIGRHGELGIQLDEEGHVSGKWFNGWRSAEPTFIERLREWLGW
jgi:hypothetical protein